MEKLSIDELRELASPRGGWCISIYLPTVDKGQQVRQNPIRYKNLLDQAHDELKEAGMEATKIEKLFEPAEDMLRDEPFWQHQQASLVVFFSDDFFRYYHLPLPVEEQVVVNNRFHLKPLLPLLHDNDEFYILAISQHEARLLKATEREVEQVNVPNMPKSLKEALGYDDLWQNQFNWSTGVGQQRSGNPQGVFHGHSEGDDNRKDYILNYMRSVNKAVTGYLNQKENKAPLILAGVEYLQPLYKEANTYQNLTDELIPGNPEGVKENELRDEAWKLIKPKFQTTRDYRMNQYKILAGRKDPIAVKDLSEIVKAAPYSRIDALFVDKNARRWGTFDPDNNEVHFDDGPRPGNEDLLDFAALQTLLNGGLVYPVDPQELPDPSSPVAAVFRF